MEWIIWIIQGLLAAMFLMAGTMKTIGVQMHIDNFNKWKYPQWFRILTGLIELVAAILLIIGYWNESMTFIAALILVVVCIGGVLTHIRAKDSMKDTSAILVLGLLSLVLLFLVI